MPKINHKISDIFSEIADLLELEGANEYRIRSYRTAAHEIAITKQNVQEMVDNGSDLTSIQGIGQQLAEKITEIVKNGELRQARSLKKKIPAFLLYLLETTSIGPKKLQTLYLELDIHSKTDLRQALASGKIKKLIGFGDKTIAELEKASQE